VALNILDYSGAISAYQTYSSVLPRILYDERAFLQVALAQVTETGQSFWSMVESEQCGPYMPPVDRSFHLGGGRLMQTFGVTLNVSD